MHQVNADVVVVGDGMQQALSVTDEFATP